ncbi:hypothetical protein [Mesorhizobium sp.]|uniref:hypothetical protein n=1 Tax=Mesorhizobium sp. TaxID=1871066 RepID=UPI00257B1461|nr:hypothetical protein [Mesorhizobium sp.]
MTADFKTVWCDSTLPNRERKRLLAYLVEDVTLLKFQAEGETRIHIRFRGGRTETLTTQNPKSSAQQVKTRPEVVELVDKLLDDHICAEIADILNARGIRPGGSARRGKADAQFTDLRVIYLVKQYCLRSRAGNADKSRSLRKTRNYRMYPGQMGEVRHREKTCLQRLYRPL